MGFYASGRARAGKMAQNLLYEVENAGNGVPRGMGGATENGLIPIPRGKGAYRGAWPMVRADIAPRRGGQQSESTQWGMR